MVSFFTPVKPSNNQTPVKQLNDHRMTIEYLCQLKLSGIANCSLLPQNAGPTVLLYLMSLNLIL